MRMLRLSLALLLVPFPAAAQVRAVVAAPGASGVSGVGASAAETLGSVPELSVSVQPLSGALTPGFAPSIAAQTPPTSPAALVVLAAPVSAAPSVPTLPKAIAPSALASRPVLAAASKDDLTRLTGEVETALKPLSDAKTGDEGASGAVDDAVAKLVSFRSEIRKPGVFLLETDPATKDDSVGRRVAAAELVPGAFAGKTLYVTGVAMGDESRAEADIRERLGAWRADVDVRVLSVPRPWSSGAIAALKDRLVYFWPSARRDHQKPLAAEIRSGVVTTLILEAPNAAFLFTLMSAPRALAVLAVHSAVLSVYTVWQRFMVNWLLRSANPAELFAKQVLLSLPFVLNYSLLAGFAPPSALHLVVTTVLQTVFYSWVITRGFRHWAATRRTAQDSEDARSWVNWLMLLPLWLDSIFLTQASTAKSVMYALRTWAGTFYLTRGHLELLGLTLAGSVVVLFPRLLDATLPVYRRFKRFTSKPRG